MAELLKRTRHYGGHSFYVMSSVEKDGKGFEVDGQALKCQP